MTPPHGSLGDVTAPDLKERVRRFYADNPDEELTWPELREKFGCSRHTARWVVRALIEDGFLESERLVRRRALAIAKEGS